MTFLFVIVWIVRRLFFFGLRYGTKRKKSFPGRAAKDARINGLNETTTKQHKTISKKGNGERRHTPYGKE